MTITELPSKRVRHADIDSLRGLAMLVVVVFHVYQFYRNARGQLYDGTVAGQVLISLDGVIGWFFVASAFLLYAPLVSQALGGGGAMTTREFLTRRLLRVVPLYWFAVIIVWSYRTSDLPGDWRDLLEHLTFTQVFDPKRIFYTIGPAWFLAVEVMFYLFMAAIIPAVLRSCRRLETRELRLFVMGAPALFLIVVSWTFKTWALVVTHIRADHWTTWFGPLAWADNLGFGMLLAVGWVAAGERRLFAPPFLVCLRAAALVLIVAAVALRGQSAASVAWFHELCMVSFVALLASSVFAPPDALWRRALARPFLVWVGTLSYSIYVWHEPLMLFMSDHRLVSATHGNFWWMAVALPTLVIPVAWVSYWMVEYPIGHLRYLFAPGGGLRDYYAGDIDKPRPHAFEPVAASPRRPRLHHALQVKARAPDD